MAIQEIHTKNNERIPGKITGYDRMEGKSDRHKKGDIEDIEDAFKKEVHEVIIKRKWTHKKQQLKNYLCSSKVVSILPEPAIHVRDLNSHYYRAIE